MDRYTSMKSKTKWSVQERGMQDVGEPEERYLPEQKGPQPTKPGGAKREKGHTRPKEVMREDDPKHQGGERRRETKFDSV